MVITLGFMGYGMTLYTNIHRKLLKSTLYRKLIQKGNVYVRYTVPAPPPQLCTEYPTGAGRTLEYPASVADSGRTKPSAGAGI